MKNEILKKINDIRIEAERKLQDYFNEDINMIALDISINIEIRDVPVDVMPEKSEERNLTNDEDAYLAYSIGKNRLYSEIFKIKK